MGKIGASIGVHWYSPNGFVLHCHRPIKGYTLNSMLYLAFCGPKQINITLGTSSTSKYYNDNAIKSRKFHAK